MNTHAFVRLAPRLGLGVLLFSGALLGISVVTSGEVVTQYVQVASHEQLESIVRELDPACAPSPVTDCHVRVHSPIKISSTEDDMVHFLGVDSVMKRPVGGGLVELIAPNASANASLDRVAVPEALVFDRPVRPFTSEGVVVCRVLKADPVSGDAVGGGTATVDVACVEDGPGWWWRAAVASSGVRETA